MRTLRELTVEEVTGILSRGTFAELISTVEHVQFECKGRLYDTKTVKSKIELANLQRIFLHLQIPGAVISS
jgi:hypothetical protein